MSVYYFILRILRFGGGISVFIFDILLGLVGTVIVLRLGGYLLFSRFEIKVVFLLFVLFFFEVL